MLTFGRFEILEILTRGPIESYRARDPVENVVVLVHTGAASLRRIALRHPEMVQEQGELDGKIYLLTPDLPEYQDLNNIDAGPEASDEAPLKGRLWKKPALSPESPAPGEFTRMFQVPAQTPPEPPVMEKEPRTDSAGPGEFTRFFSQLSSDVRSADAPDISEEPTRTMTAYRPRPDPENRQEKEAAPAPADEPAGKVDVEDPPVDGFTRVFSAPPAPASAPDRTVLYEVPKIPDAKGTPPPAEPGAFTRLFASPNVELPGSHLNSAPQEPGEFTRIFAQTPSPSQAIPAASLPNERANLEPRPQVAPEFTKIFASPLPNESPEIDFEALGRNPLPPSKAPEKPAGDFTQMFGKPLQSEPIPPKPAASPNNATVLFQSPQMARMPPPPSGPSEFTQMFGKPRLQPVSEPAATPKTPTESKPKTAPPLGALVLIFAALLVIAIILILFLVLRH